MQQEYDVIHPDDLTPCVCFFADLRTASSSEQLVVVLSVDIKSQFLKSSFPQVYHDERAYSLPALNLQISCISDMYAVLIPCSPLYSSKLFISLRIHNYFNHECRIYFPFEDRV